MPEQVHVNPLSFIEGEGGQAMEKIVFDKIILKGYILS